MRTARGVPLRLRHLGYVNDRGDVVAASALDRDLVDVDARHVVVTLHGVEVQSRSALLTPEALEHRRDRALRRLELVRHRDAIPVVPDGDDERDLQHTGRVEAFPEHALARACVPDGGEADFLSVVRETARDRARGGRFAVQLRCPGQADRPGHLRADRGKLGRGLPRSEKVLPFPAFVERPRREVAQHLATRRVRVADDVWVGVELREVLGEIGQSDREHERLVAVIPRPPVTRSERVRHPELGDLLALAGYAKRGVPD